MKFPAGLELNPATQEEIDHVEANYRPGERREQEVENAGRTLLDEFEQCWTVRAGGEIIGYFGVLVIPDESVMSRSRGFCFMSCEAANRHKLAFVKDSRPVYRWVVEQCPPWTDVYVSWPLASYVASVKWQKRVLGMREVARQPVHDGEEYVIFELTREEVQSWR